MSRIDRYQQPELFERLASEYVLGTLHGSARRRFVDLMQERPYLQHAVEEWQTRLDPLGNAVPAVRPRQRVWTNIRREIRGQPRAAADSQGFWGSVLAWRTTAFAVLAMLATLVVYQIFPAQQTAPHMPHYMAVLENTDNTPMIVATASPDPRHIKIMMMDEPDIAPDQDWQLWAISEGSDAPMAIGLLDRGKETKIMLDDSYWSLMGKARYLAISAEPQGGSPTGAPTGPVMYKGEIMSFVLKG